jgi:hypothetical protein
MGQIDKIFAAVAAIGRHHPSTVVNAVKDADDAA